MNDSYMGSVMGVTLCTSELRATCPHVGSESGNRKLAVLTRTLVRQNLCQPCSVAVRICIILQRNHP